MKTNQEIDSGLTRGDKTYFLLWGMAILSVIIWNFPIINIIQYPFMLLGTWFHEMGHGLTALILGGTFEKLEIFANGSGLAYSRHSNLWVNPQIGSALIALGGLIGPTIAGGMMVISGRHQNWSRIALFSLASVILLSVGIWVRTAWGIGIMSGIAVVLLYAAIKWSKRKQQLLIQYLGIQASLSTFLNIGYLFTEKAFVGGEENLSGHRKYCSKYIWKLFSLGNNCICDFIGDSLAEFQIGY